MDMGRNWRGTEAWKEEERLESRCCQDLGRGAEAWKEEERMESGCCEDLERSRSMEGREKDGE